MNSLGETTIRDLLDPFTQERRDLVLSGTSAGGTSARVPREIDGSSWWLLPAVSDADAHMPFVPAGLRPYDLLAALHGGVNQMVIALPFQLTRRHSLPDLAAELAQQSLPAITPVISVLPDAGSTDFPQWLKENLGHIRDLLPGVVKLYTGDPNFRSNLDAVRRAELKPAVFAYTPEDFDELVRVEDGPLHVRHVTSRAMLDAVHSIDGATCQTSPHMVLELEPGRREALTVMPVPPGGADRASLMASVTDLDMIASDHVSPPVGEPTGPGLQTQQHFVPALLSMAEESGVDLADLWKLVTLGPRAVLGLADEPGSIVVDPDFRQQAGLWPRQAEDRAPYLGRGLRGRVLAVTRGDHGVVV